MTAAKSLIANTSQIYRHRSFGYEPQNLLCLDNQALIFVFFEKLLTASSNKRTFFQLKPNF